jgi:hypothetical protein
MALTETVRAMTSWPACAGTAATAPAQTAAAIAVILYFMARSFGVEALEQNNDTIYHTSTSRRPTRAHR